MNDRSKLLWIDSLGGLFVGTLVLALSRFIAGWHNLPLALIVFMGCMNLLYGSFSGYLTLARQRPLNLICTLAIANMTWLFVCCLFTAYWWTDISVLGVFHFVGEGVYVAGLGLLEWRWKESLATADKVQL